DEISRAQHELDQLGEEDDAQRRLLAERIAELDQDAEALRARLHDVEAARSAAQALEAEARKAASVAQAKLARVAQEERALARVLSSEETGKWPAVIDQLSVAPGYEAALGAAMGDDLSASTDPSAPAFWQNLGAYEGDAPNLPPGAEPLSSHVIAPPAL